MDRRYRPLLGFGGIVLVVSAIAFVTTRSIVAKLGHPGAPLDDSYIHFQYARAIAEGHPFRFQAGEPPTSGATSLLWPALLAPFYALGARGENILLAAWSLSFIALALLAWDSLHLTRRLAGAAAGVGAAALVLSFGGFVWGAASGMEVVPFAWSMTHAVRRAAEWSEDSPHERSYARGLGLALLAWVAPLLRPEGGVTALFVAATLLIFPGRAHKTSWLAVIAVGAVMAVPLLLFVTTGSFRSTTAVVKLLPGNPYVSGRALLSVIGENIQFLRTSILDGGAYSAEFVPVRSAPFAVTGLFAVAFCGVSRHAKWRAAGVILIALLMLAPCAYVTFLWNRLRYLWPFATGWLIGIACLARAFGEVVEQLIPRWRLTTGLLSGAAAGLLGAKLPLVIDDIALSASGIDRQQVALGQWAKSEIPDGARIGVNDTGAIAYFGDHKTFDIVGLTTASEAKYWVAGPASRFEHYERLHQTAPASLPDYFIVYPEWMACPPVLGSELCRATVLDSTILGGQTMAVRRADYSLLGSGSLPWTELAGTLADELDVGDLESEAAHGYLLEGARDGEEIVTMAESPAGKLVADGARTNRHADRFVVHLGEGRYRGIARLLGPKDGAFEISVNDAAPIPLHLADAEWTEAAFDFRLTEAGARVSVRAGGEPFTSFHYWFWKQ